MSKYPCEFCRDTGIIPGEREQFSNDWTADRICPCATVLSEREMVFLARLTSIFGEDGKPVLYADSGEYQCKPVGMDDDKWDEFLDKIRKAYTKIGKDKQENE